ncbi:hypothetical protein QWY82_07380 [Simiduia curdlanivorans]|uniref:Uncharacterized protein n=1 Tax=Simiduia curdlanivorans TaxID=1492769 RepID=A0ABV8V966_9GAMM|nr:hypothetical protein [Simiduia curdlanivorans]MDN3638623.1 hypothetical protein [Simiduia curdlanivorans]
MWYKRYGYKQPSGSGAATIPYVGITLFLVIICIPIIVIFKTLLPLVVMIPVALAFFYIAEKVELSQGQEIQDQRRMHHLKNVTKNFFLGRKQETLESIRKAKIYGELPPQVKKIEKHLGEDQ